MNKSMFGAYLYYYAKEKGLSLTDAAKAVRKLGLDSIDIDLDDLGGYSLDEYEVALKASGLTMIGVHGLAQFAAKDPKRQKAEYARAQEMIDVAVRFGATQILVVPGIPGVIDGVADKPRAVTEIVKGIRWMIAAAKPHGITISIENFSRIETPYATIGECLSLLNKVDGLGFTYDTGNFACRGVDELEAYDRLRPHFVHVHFKDWLIGDHADCIPVLDGRKFVCSGIGEGFIHCEEVLNRLKTDGYNGALVLEFNAFSADEEVSPYLERSMKWLNARL